MGWYKKPVTHAFGLWVIVGFATLLLIIFFGYSSMLAEIEKNTVVSYPAQTVKVVQQSPSVFGTVISLEQDGTIFVDSKQSFDTILVDDVTRVMRVGGGEFEVLDLKNGARVMATGTDIGGGVLRADALVVLENDQQ